MHQLKLLSSRELWSVRMSKMGYFARQTALTVSVPLIALVGLVASGGIAGAESVVLGDSSGQLIRDCSKTDVVVSGNNDRIVLTGGCHSLTILGDGNEILADMDAGTKISLSGNNNNLAWGKSSDGVDPSVVDGGRGNTVVHFRHVPGKGDAAQSVAAKDSVRTPESIESAKTAATAKSLEELKKDLGVKEGATGEMAQIPNEIMFAFDSDQLRPSATNILAECAELIQREHAKHVRVIGHSDSVGRVDYNLELSKRRALTVKSWLVKQGGIANRDLLAIGLGPKKPMASNDTAEDRAKNRRVEVMIPTNEALQQPPPKKK
jgi:outer membrane protein OmpA-like peptidoglycan-associated protein